jgi:hypothetical protein
MKHFTKTEELMLYSKPVARSCQAISFRVGFKPHF